MISFSRALRNMHVLFAAVLLGGFARGEDKVLFIGNSFTIGSGGSSSVPELFRRLAVAGGHGDPLVVMRAVGGQDYKFHENDATTRAAIASEQWTHVVLQNFSTQPTHIGSVSDHNTYGTLLYNRILANNPATQVVLYETWSRSAVHSLISGTSTSGTFASTGEMQSELRLNYDNLRDSLNVANPGSAPVLVAPAGDAWENSGSLLPTTHPLFIKLHGNDEYHANNDGYFLNAAVMYAKIYGQSPVGLHTDPAFSSLNYGFTSDPVFLEKTAWETVNGTSPVVFTEIPAPQTVLENASVTFRASVLGSRPYTVQWLRNSEPIPGADALVYTVPSASASLDGSQYAVRIGNGGGVETSPVALLTVIPDSAPPVPGVPVLANGTTVRIVFNEALATGPATDATNFTVVFQGRKIPVVSSALSTDGTTVTLTLSSAISPGFAVGFGNALTDAGGNAIPVDTLEINRGSPPQGRTFLIDFGGAGDTTLAANDPLRTWNNVTPAIGGSNTASINPLRDTAAVTGTARLEMVRRFNGSNASGSDMASAFPVSASKDTLYGNTEAFNSLADVFPAFRIAGLDPGLKYSATFYASRTGVTDNRETRYTVTGDAVNSAVLNVSNNINSTAVLSDLKPDASGNLLIELSPTASNNNANHFTYLGALVLAAASTDLPAMFPPVVLGNRILLDWTGPGELEFSPDLKDPWTVVSPAAVPPHSELLNGSSRFFRVRIPAP